MTHTGGDGMEWHIHKRDFKVVGFDILSLTGSKPAEQMI